jgi:uncharacterized protein (DUF1778 family)
LWDLCGYNLFMAGKPKESERVKRYTLRVRMTDADRQLLEEAARSKSLEMSTWARSELVALAHKTIAKKKR